jgi:hypothetical protein
MTKTKIQKKSRRYWSRERSRCGENGKVFRAWYFSPNWEDNTVHRRCDDRGSSRLWDSRYLYCKDGYPRRHTVNVSVSGGYRHGGCILLGPAFVYPIFIAITALARLIVLQGKDMAPENILYEAIAIFILAIAAIVLICMRTEWHLLGKWYIWMQDRGSY